MLWFFGISASMTSNDFFQWPNTIFFQMPHHKLPTAYTLVKEQYLHHSHSHREQQQSENNVWSSSLSLTNTFDGLSQSLFHRETEQCRRHLEARQRQGMAKTRLTFACEGQNSIFKYGKRTTFSLLFSDYANNGSHSWTSRTTNL